MAFPECLKNLPGRYAFVRCENKVRFRIFERKSQLFQLLLRPLSRFHHFFHRLAEIFHIADRCGSGCDRGLIHGIRIERIFHIIQIRNHLLISDCIADAHAGKRTGF